MPLIELTRTDSRQGLKAEIAVATKSLSKNLGDGYVEFGQTDEGRQLTYFIVPSIRSYRTEVSVQTWNWKDYYLLDDEFQVKRKICGMISSTQNKERSRRCLAEAGKGTDHQGEGYCASHKNNQVVENSFRRKYVLSHLKSFRTDASPFITLMQKLDNNPVEPEMEMEGLVNLLTGLLYEKTRLEHERDTLQFTDPESDSVIINYARLLKGCLKDLYEMKRLSSITPSELLRFMDEIEQVLRQRYAMDFAKEIMAEIMSTKGLLDKASIIAATGVNGKAVEAYVSAFPLGYSSKDSRLDIDSENGRKEKDDGES